jgi:hypothetical protein
MGKGGVRRNGSVKFGKPSSYVQVGTVQYDVQLHRGKPGPGQYDVKHKTVAEGCSGGRFNRGQAKSALDRLIYEKKSIPGPSAYGNPHAALNVPSGGRFSTAAVPTYIDVEQKRASQIPGPGQYHSEPKTPAGQSWGKSSAPSVMDVLISRANNSPAPWDTSRLQSTVVPGGRWSTTKAKTELDWIVYRAERLPAPGQYGNPSPMMVSGGRIGRSSVPGSIDVLQARMRRLPGPGQYDVDNSYEHSTFCNKVRLEEARNMQRAATSIGAARTRSVSQVHSDDEEGSPNWHVPLDGTAATDIDGLMRRYSDVARSTSSQGMRPGVFNPRQQSTRHIFGDFSGDAAGGSQTQTDDALSKAPPVGDPRRAAFLRRNLPKLHSG